MKPFGGDVINKQIFLAELGRLLTFMYDDDRLTAIDMFEQMFDACADEQKLLQYLVSPTRQAVILARAYDTKERKMRGKDDDSEPSFITAINNIKADAPAMFFEENPTLFEEMGGEESVFEIAAAQVQEDGPAQEQDEEEDFITVLPQQISVEDLAEPMLEQPEAEPESEAADEAAEEPEKPEEDTQTEQEDKEIEDSVENEAEAYLADNSVGEFVDAVDAFLADFSIEDGELIKTDDKTKSVRKPEKAEEPEQPEELQTPDRKIGNLEALRAAFEDEAEDDNKAPKIVFPEQKPAKKPSVVVELEDEEEDETPTVRKARVFLLIVYLLFAIPITLTLIGLLLIPTVVSFCAAVVAAWVSVSIFSAALSFAVFAETLVIIGAGLLAAAAAVLFLWLFIWFIGGAIVGLVRGVVLLADKWCYKEVAAE